MNPAELKTADPFYRGQKKKYRRGRGIRSLYLGLHIHARTTEGILYIFLFLLLLSRGKPWFLGSERRSGDRRCSLSTYDDSFASFILDLRFLFSAAPCFSQIIS